MKTMTITLHDTDNCGSSLQAFALQTFLLENGVDNEIIDYVPNYVKNNGSALKSFIKHIIYFKYIQNRNKKFKEFKKRFLKITKKKYKNIMELNNSKLDCDCLITGSDQLWNSSYMCGRDSVFYLDFDTNARKIAYAVSVGKSKIGQDNLNIIKTNVNNFDWISVREGTTVSQLKQLFPDTNIDYVCDPVLLNESDAYNDIKSKRIIEDEYILVYMAQIPDTEKINNIINKIRKKYNDKIVLIGSYRNRCDSDIHIRDVAPGDFLSLIYNAKYIVSNSFHATMFSLIYEKDFLSILPEKNGTRIKEILDKVGLSKNYIDFSSKEYNIPEIKRYEEIRKKLNEFRNFSRKKLLENVMVKNNE